MISGFPWVGLLALLGLTGCVQDYGVLEIPRDDPQPGSDAEPVTGWAALAVAQDICEDPLPPVESRVSVDENCVTDNSSDLDFVLEWKADHFGEYYDFAEILMTPVVGRLDDDNQDGVIDEQDTPDIVVVTDEGFNPSHIHGILRIMDGSGLGDSLSLLKVSEGELDYYPYQYSNVALGDVNNDGTPEIIFVAEVLSNIEPDEPGPPPDTGEEQVRSGDESNCGVAAITALGEFVWGQTDPPIVCGGHSPALADLDGDGQVEVLVGNLLLRGLDGSVITTLAEGYGAHLAYEHIGYQSFPADLEGDGQMEIITGRSIHEWNGVLRCEIPNTEDGFPGVADLDQDGRGEVVVVGNNHVRIFDSNCQVVIEFDLVGSGNGGPPTIADMDGDSVPEIGIADAEYYAVYEQDGSLLWKAEVTDESSHATGSSVFDFDGNGLAEVLYADETRLWVFDGATGRSRFTDSDHSSRTLHEYPVVVDVDGDGEAEIVVPNGGAHDGTGPTGVMVYGSGGEPWREARPVWNQHAYSITNVSDDLGVPRGAAPNWPTYNSFRSGSLTEASLGKSPDAIPLIEGTCLDDCPEGRLQVGLRLGNEGMGELRAEVPMSLYAYWGEDDMTHIMTVQSTGAVASGSTTTTLVVELEAALLWDASLLLVADDDGSGGSSVAECDETNNRLILEGPFCGE